SAANSHLYRATIAAIRGSIETYATHVWDSVCHFVPRRFLLENINSATFGVIGSMFYPQRVVSSGYTTHSDGGTLGTAFRHGGLRPGAAVFYGDAALAGASSLPVRPHQAARGHGGSGGPQFGGRRHGAGQPRGYAHRRAVSFLVF